MKYAAIAFFLIVNSAQAAPPHTVPVPGGTMRRFWITPKDSNAPEATMKVEGFEAMVSPVTNGDFLDFVKKQPAWRKSKVPGLFAEPGYLAQFTGDVHLSSKVSLKEPANYVSWFAARAYCGNLGMRLPTIEEWEYMAAASESARDASKDPAFLERILQWYSEPERDGIKNEVGRRAANIYGIRDLHGLVWEWVEDFNSALVSGESREDGALNRDLFCGAGGMSGGNKENYAAFMRFAFRSSLKGKNTAWNLGFRCVKSSGGRQ